MANRKQQPMEGEHPTNNPLWQKFTLWCDESNVSLNFREDWIAWWDCWIWGAKAQIELDDNPPTKKRKKR